MSGAVEFHEKCKFLLGGDAEPRIDLCPELNGLLKQKVDFRLPTKPSLKTEGPFVGFQEMHQEFPSIEDEIFNREYNIFDKEDSVDLELQKMIEDSKKEE